MYSIRRNSVLFNPHKNLVKDIAAPTGIDIRCALQALKEMYPEGEKNITDDRVSRLELNKFLSLAVQECFLISDGNNSIYFWDREEAKSN